MSHRLVLSAFRQLQPIQFDSYQYLNDEWFYVSFLYVHIIQVSFFICSIVCIVCVELLCRCSVGMGKTERVKKNR